MVHGDKAKRWQGCKRLVVFGAAEVRVFVDRFSQRDLNLCPIQIGACSDKSQSKLIVASIKVTVDLEIFIVNKIFVYHLNDEN